MAMSDPAINGGDLERARRLVREGPSLAWDASSRFGPAGLAARALVRRALGPQAARQGALDRELLDALDASAAGAAARLARLEHHAGLAREATHAVTLDPEGVVEATTPAGTLWLNTANGRAAPEIVQRRPDEPHLSALLPRLLRPGMTFVDAGANVGYVSVLASRLVGPEGLVIAVEPGPARLAQLHANLWRNGCTNAIVLPIAADSHRGHVRLVLDPRGGAGSGERPGELPMPTVLAPCAPLDELLGDLRVDVLRTAAEGGDVQAIRGMEQAVRRSSGITIVAEFSAGSGGGRGESPAEVLEYYAGLGLGLARLEDSGEVSPIGAAALLGLADTAPSVNVVLS